MADFSYIIQEINANLPDNNQQRITAHALRQTMVDLTYTIADEQNDWELQASYILDDVEHALENIIVDNLTSSYTDRALSANQGKELNLRLTDVEDKTQYIRYADAGYTNFDGTLSVSGDVEATNGQFESVSVDALDIEGEDIMDMFDDITEKTNQLVVGNNDSGSYMWVMTNDFEGTNIKAGDTMSADYLEVMGNEMTLGNIVINDANSWLTTSNINATSYLVVGTHNVGNELETLNTKMVKCTQQQYDTWSALGQIDSNKFYFIIENSTASTNSLASTTSLDTTSLDTTSLDTTVLTKSANLSTISEANLSTVSVDESIIDTNIEQEDEVNTTEIVEETEEDIKTDEVEER